MTEGIRWHLELGGIVIARILDAKEYEFPWTYGILVESPEFERFRVYFTDPDSWPEDVPEMDELCDEVRERGEFLLRDFQTGIVHTSFSLNQNGEYVWFRIG